MNNQKGNPHRDNNQRTQVTGAFKVIPASSRLRRSRIYARRAQQRRTGVLPVNQIVVGNALDVLQTFPTETVDMVVTSPPYWALRSYGTLSQIWPGDQKAAHDHIWSADKFCLLCNAWLGELGREPNPELYVIHLCDVFDQIGRVLKPTGSCWVNLGDTFNARRNGGHPGGEKQREDGRYPLPSGANVRGLQPKCLVQILARFAIAMTDRGWILRNELIWHKPNCMPQSAKDRFRVDFEKIFFFTKSRVYYFETQCEPLVQNSDVAYRQRLRKEHLTPDSHCPQGYPREVSHFPA